MSNTLDQLGVLTLGPRLRRLTDLLYHQSDEIYRRSGLDFQASWFPIMFLLADQEAVSVTEMAIQMRQTHSAVSQVVKKLINKGYIERFKDESDLRRSDLVLTDAGADLIVKLQPVWSSLVDVLNDMVDSTDYDLIGALDAYEAQLTGRDLVDEVMTS